MAWCGDGEEHERVEDACEHGHGRVGDACEHGDRRDGEDGGAGGEEEARQRRRPGAAARCRDGRRLRLREERKKEPYGSDTMLG